MLAVPRGMRDIPRHSSKGWMALFIDLDRIGGASSGMQSHASNSQRSGFHPTILVQPHVAIRTKDLRAIGPARPLRRHSGPATRSAHL
jgi:hypothetical protein